MTKQQWIKGEVMKWLEKMKENSKYDNTIHSQKSWVLSHWLTKTFEGISLKQAKELLYECEKEMYSAEESTMTKTSEQDDSD